MKMLIIIPVVLIVIGIVYFFYLGYKSQSGSAIGLVDSKLSPCPDKPNCICTEFPEDKSHFTKAINLENHSIASLTKAVEEMGGEIVVQEANYIAAIFSSSIFRYVDDFEIRIDAENNLIHIRSASRVGHSDMGVNLTRVEFFKDNL